MIEVEMLPAKIQMEVAVTEDGLLTLTLIGESANWVMKRFEKSAGFEFENSSLEPHTKRRRVLFGERRRGADDWQPLGGGGDAAADAARLPAEELLWQAADGTFHFGVVARDAADGEIYVATAAGAKLPLAEMRAWRSRPAGYRAAAAVIEATATGEQ